MALSKDPDKRATQLANLKAAPPAPPAGNRRHVTHGGYARIATDRLNGRVALVFDALAEDVPLRDGAGKLPAADNGVVHLLARCLCRLEDVQAHLDSTGWLDQSTGEPRLAVLDAEARLRGEAARLMASLGMTPTSRAKLGLDLTRTVDLATAMSEPDAAKRQALLREAGVDDA